MIFGRKAKQAEYIVDVHCHILPGIDDGSRSMEETLKMLRIAADEGITHVIATPHYKLEHNNATPGQVDELIDAVQAEASKNNIPIVIYQGNEVLFFNEFDEYLENFIYCDFFFFSGFNIKHILPFFQQRIRVNQPCHCLPSSASSRTTSTI